MTRLGRTGSEGGADSFRRPCTEPSAAVGGFHRDVAEPGGGGTVGDHAGVGEPGAVGVVHGEVQ